MFAPRFVGVEMGKPLEVFALTKSFLEDKLDKKVNLTMGAYRDEEGKPWVLPVVRKVEQAMAQDKFKDHEYLPVLGLETFSQLAITMLLGTKSPAILEGRVFGVQSLSGTGSLRIGAEFLSQTLQYNTFYCSKPTWGSHALVFMNGGFKNSREYRYWNPITKSIDFDGMLEDLRNAPENAVIILHACAHNPTGCDPTEEQWQRIADVIEEKKLLAFFDTAYQGLATGDLDRDAYPVRLFDKRGMEFLCAQSFAKNMGLYGERIGNLVVVINSINDIPKARIQFSLIVRGMYSTPPNYGARVVINVLGNPKLNDEWTDQIRVMSDRIKNMRRKLYERILELKTPGNWEHIVNLKGMFFYSGLTERQILHLKDQYGIYMLRSGRICVCGLNERNINYVADCIHRTITQLPQDY